MRRTIALILTAASALGLWLALAGSTRAQERTVNLAEGPQSRAFSSTAPPPLQVLEMAHRVLPWRQVRIEQHVIIRIAPSAPDSREQRLSDLPGQGDGDQPEYREVPYGDCVNIDDIVGVSATTDNRLLLFMRDNGVLAARLEPACPAQAFYSGFYVQRSKDGRLCASRDTLHSRAGQSCSIDSLSRLVAAGH